MAEKLIPEQAHGLLTSAAPKRNTWCNIDEFVSTNTL